MGLYSEVFNSCPELGSNFMGILQTKDLENLLDFYWLSPSGQLFKVLHQFAWDGGVKGGVIRPYRFTGLLKFRNYSNSQYSEIGVFLADGVLEWWLPVVLDGASLIW